MLCSWASTMQGMRAVTTTPSSSSTLIFRGLFVCKNVQKIPQSCKCLNSKLMSLLNTSSHEQSRAAMQLCTLITCRNRHSEAQRDMMLVEVHGHVRWFKLLLTMRRMLRMPRFWRMFLTEEYSLQSSGSPSALLASTVSNPSSCTTMGAA